MYKRQGLGRADADAVGQLGPGRPVRLDDEAPRLGPVEDDAGALAGHQQGAGEAARIGLMVPVDPHAPAYARREHRLQAAALAPREPLRVEAGPLLQLVQFAQVRAVVGVEGDGERATGAVADLLAARLGQLGRERRIAAGGVQVDGEQILFAVVQFGDGGQHPGRDLGRAAAGRGVRDGGAQPALGRSPRGDQADDAAADDENVPGGRSPPRWLRRRRVHASSPSLRRHDPDQVRTVGGRPASLSARSVRAPASALPRSP